MPAGMEVDITAGSLDKLDQALDRIAERLEGIAGTTDKIKSNVQGTKLPAGSGGGSGGGKGAGKGAEERFLSGPRQDLERIAAERKRAEGLADETRKQRILGDLADREFNARRRIALLEKRRAGGEEAINQPGLLELFGDLNRLMASVKSGDVLGAARAVSRVQFLNTQEGAGGLNIETKLGRSNLGGRLPVAQVIQTAEQAAAARAGATTAAGAAEAGGAEAAAAGVGAAGLAGASSLLLPVGAVVVGLLLAAKAAQLFAQETQASAARLHEHGDQAFLSGGYEAARLRALGVDPSGLGGLRDRLATDGMAQYTATRYGIPYTQQSQYSLDQNDSRLELAVLNAIRQAYKEQGLDEARRVARIFGREGDLPKALVSDRVFNLSQRVGANGEFIDKKYSQSGRDFDRQMELLGEQGNQLKDLALAPLLHQLEMGLGGVNTILERTIGVGGKFADAWDKATALIMQWDPITGPLLRGLQGAGGSGSAQQTAQQANTQSNYDLIDAIQKLAATFHKAYGGGPFGDAGSPRADRDNPAALKAWRDNTPYWDWTG